MAEAQRQYIRTKIYPFHCRSTCHIRVRITNISYKNLFRVNLRATIYVNGHRMGRCNDYLGNLRAKHVRYASCTVRTGKLANYWDRWQSGDLSRWRPYVDTYTSYHYYY